MFYSIHISRLTCSISILECSIYFMSMTFQNLNWFLCTITVFKLMARPFLLLWCLYLTMTHNLGIGNLPCNTFVQVLHVRSLCSCYWDKSRLAHPEKAIFSNKVQWYILWSVEYRYNKTFYTSTCIGLYTPFDGTEMFEDKVDCSRYRIITPCRAMIQNIIL